MRYLRWVISFSREGSMNRGDNSQVNVIHLQLLQRCLESSSNIVDRSEDFSGDIDLFPFDAALLDCGSDFRLSLVDWGILVS